METIIAAVLVISGLGFLLGYGLAFAAKKLETPRDERAAAVEQCLPGVNCGACGYAGCSGYAQAIVTQGVPLHLCAPGGAEAANAIGRIMGIAVHVGAQKKVRIHCGGGSDVTRQKFRYNGVADCRSAAALFDGFLQCSAGCLGLGSCVNVCRFDAISIDANGHTTIREDRCTGCGACVPACPRKLIELVEADRRVHVLCNSTEKGAVCNKICQVGCIGCMKCEKTCRYDAIHVINNLAIIDYAKCTSCGECVPVCPKKCIIDLGKTPGAS
ncbi:MAG TPA: RnfABCDGE type electron transport complex subunit B [Spirochaetota bacterium]|nr:RnfABCDGE type electron transport complex subunit B [Spirochaetota bacterium]